MNTNAKTELRRAYLMIEWGRLDDALAACDRAKELLPSPHPMPDALAGSFLSAFGHHTDALKRFRRALRLDPDHIFSNIAFAETCLFLGRDRQARRALERVERSEGPAEQWREEMLSLQREIGSTDGIVVAR